MITSRKHAIVTRFRHVARGDPHLALLDGWHLIQDAERAGVVITEVGVSPAALDPAAAALLDRLATHDTKITQVSPEVLHAISPVHTPSGIVATARRPLAEMTSMLEPAPSLVILATGLQDPGNVGALLRSAEALGATGVMLDGEAADPWGWKALRAAMGSTFRLPVVRERHLPSTCEELRRRGVQLLAAVPRGGTLVHEHQLTGPVAFVIGGEGSGLPAHLLSLSDATVSVQMRGAVESLNVAVAAALLLYEAGRQRRERMMDRETA